MVLALLGAAGCAVDVTGALGAIDQRAAAARTSEEHAAIARDYEAYAERLSSSAHGSAAWGQDEDRLARRLNEENPGQRQRWISMGPHWQMRAMSLAREAEDALAKAREHRAKAAASRP